VPVLEHFSEIPFDKPPEDRIEAQGKRVFDLVAENGAVAIGQDYVLVPPVSEWTGLLDVGKQAIVFVLDMDGDPGFIKRSEAKTEFNAGADFEAACTGNQLDFLPWGQEERKYVGAFMEREEGFGSSGKSGLMNEISHAGCKLSLL